MSNNHKIRYLEMGSCYNDYSSYGIYRKWLGCAWEPSDCDLTVDGNSFVGTDQDEDFIKKCNPSDQITGRCKIEDTCALRASDCATETSGTNFRANDATCTIQRDKSKEWNVNDPQYTQFGSCFDNVSGEYFCIFNPSDCDESGNEVYVSPADTLALGVICDCSEVHVAGCVTESKRAFCAINADGCRPTWDYFSPHTLRLDRDPNFDGPDLSHTPGLDCRLCRKKNTESPTPAPTPLLKPTKNPTRITTDSLVTFSPTQSPLKAVTDSIEESADIAENNDGNGGKVGLIVGVTIGGVVFLGLAAFFYIRQFRAQTRDIERKRRRRRRKRREKPPLEITARDNFGEDHLRGIRN